MEVTVSACGKNPVSDGEKTTAQDESHRYNEITMESKGKEIVEAGTNSYEPVFPRHEPYGTGLGAQPGRVV